MNLLSSFRLQLQLIVNFKDVSTPFSNNRKDSVAGHTAYTPSEYGNLVMSLESNSQFLAVAACFGEISAAIMNKDLNATSKVPESVHSIKLFGHLKDQNVLADFFIAATTCYYLHKGGTMTGFSSTTKVIVSLMRFAVMSGLTTSTSLGQIVSFTSQSILLYRSST
ncbi:hypothetical protein IW261DRAFT_1418256 [Armillaria novae-zelandiae]|uniref:DUF6534 domain-containing protein n=1 Tax=Armillaria novae-zelandiae TaxID=153914 RepID=A0AA39UKM4_9AGAR|nr:hypothetical protein IW261DRAFT_1418256 [Armillaria novae-zelandiae]